MGFSSGQKSWGIPERQKADGFRLEMALKPKGHSEEGYCKGGSSELGNRGHGDTEEIPDQLWETVGSWDRHPGIPSPQWHAVNCRSDYKQDQGVGGLDPQRAGALEQHWHPGRMWSPHTPNTRIWDNRHSSPGTQPSHCSGHLQPHWQANRKFQTQRQVHNPESSPI